MSAFSNGWALTVHFCPFLLLFLLFLTISSSVSLLFSYWSLPVFPLNYVVKAHCNELSVSWFREGSQCFQQKYETISKWLSGWLWTMEASPIPWWAELGSQVCSLNPTSKLVHTAPLLFVCSIWLCREMENAVIGCFNMWVGRDVRPPVRISFSQFCFCWTLTLWKISIWP